jgi:hypothetical protein
MSQRQEEQDKRATAQMDSMKVFMTEQAALARTASETNLNEVCGDPIYCVHAKFTTTLMLLRNNRSKQRMNNNMRLVLMITNYDAGG